MRNVESRCTISCHFSPSHSSTSSFGSQYLTLRYNWTRYRIGHSMVLSFSSFRFALILAKVLSWFGHTLSSPFPLLFLPLLMFSLFVAHALSFHPFPLELLIVLSYLFLRQEHAFSLSLCLSSLSYSASCIRRNWYNGPMSNNGSGFWQFANFPGGWSTERRNGAKRAVHVWSGIFLCVLCSYATASLIVTVFGAFSCSTSTALVYPACVTVSHAHTLPTLQLCLVYALASSLASFVRRLRALSHMCYARHYHSFFLWDACTIYKRRVFLSSLACNSSRKRTCTSVAERSTTMALPSRRQSLLALLWP